MQHSPSYGTILVIVVSALSLAAGLVVVMVTSPDSIRLGSQIQAANETTSAGVLTGGATSTATAVTSTPVPTPPATAAPIPLPTGASATTPVVAASDTPEATSTAAGPIVPTLAPDALSIGQIVTDNNSTARLRSLPGLEGKVIEAIPTGEYVQVLGKSQKADDIEWLPIRHNNLIGWVAKGLVVPVNLQP